MRPFALEFTAGDFALAAGHRRIGISLAILILIAPDYGFRRIFKYHSRKSSNSAGRSVSVS
jgi:hypothetical protein